MTRHHSTLICEEAREMLKEAGFEIVSNDTGRILSREEQKALIQDAYAIIAGTEKYDREMLEGCENLKVVTRFGVGTDNFDLQAMREMGLQVGVIANYNAVAEFALTLILSVMKNLPRYDAAVREGKWSRFSMRELTGKTVGLVGFGRIGRRLAELLSGFGVTILAYDPFINEDAAKERHVQVSGLEELLEKSDIVSLHLPSTKETHHLINAETIKKMKDGAYLINTARGALVNEEDLIWALENGQIAAAGLDVFQKEPPDPDNKLLTLHNVMLLPHSGAGSYECLEKSSAMASGNVIDFFQSKTVKTILNPRYAENLR